MSKAAKKRAHRRSRQLAPAAPRKAQAPTAPQKPPTAQRHKTGLEWLSGKRKITRDQLQAGARYGKDFRLAEVEGMDPLRSCLDSEPRGSGGTALMSRPLADSAARQALLAARSALTFHVGMIAACDLICGRGFTPWEAMPGRPQREVEKLVTTLSLALDILVAHYRLQNN